MFLIHDKISYNHLADISRSHENAKYTSATVKNEIIDIIDSDIILRGIV